MVLETKEEVKKLNAEIKVKGNSLAKNDYVNLLGKLSEAENKELQSNVLAFKEFLKENPQSDVSTHLMQKLNYEEDPASFYAIYQTLSPAAKNSDDGKEIGEKLSHLIKLVVGVKAPAIVGKMPDGKSFDPKTLTTKLTLIDFWRASNEISRRNHQDLITLLKDQKDKSTLGILSVSLDTKQDWWTTALNEDHMTWTQVSDLKGDDSPNAVNWSITTLPTYYMVDKDWKIVARDLNFSNIDLEVSTYLSKHR